MATGALPSFSFGRRNWILAAAGLVSIIVGYVLLRIPPADGFISLTLAPLLLVTGYCGLIPAAILVKDRQPGRGNSADPGKVTDV
jgi:uncharacterized membrane protein HdeD (DUF308 family)